MGINQTFFKEAPSAVWLREYNSALAKAASVTANKNILCANLYSSNSVHYASIISTTVEVIKKELGWNLNTKYFMRVRQFKIRTNQGSFVKQSTKHWTSKWNTTNKSLWRYCLRAEILFFKTTRRQTDRSNTQYGGMSCSFTIDSLIIEHISFSYLYKAAPIKNKFTYEKWTLSANYNKNFKVSKYKHLVINKNNFKKLILLGKFYKLIKKKLNKKYYKNTKKYRKIKFWTTLTWFHWKKIAKKYRDVKFHFLNYEKVEINRIVHNKAKKFRFHSFYKYTFKKYLTYKINNYYIKYDSNTAIINKAATLFSLNLHFFYLINLHIKSNTHFKKKYLASKFFYKKKYWCKNTHYLVNLKRLRGRRVILKSKHRAVLTVLRIYHFRRYHNFVHLKYKIILDIIRKGLTKKDVGYYIFRLNKIKHFLKRMMDDYLKYFRITKKYLLFTQKYSTVTYKNLKKKKSKKDFRFYKKPIIITKKKTKNKFKKLTILDKPYLVHKRFYLNASPKDHKSKKTGQQNIYSKNDLAHLIINAKYWLVQKKKLKRNRIWYYPTLNIKRRIKNRLKKKVTIYYQSTTENFIKYNNFFLLGYLKNYTNLKKYLKMTKKAFDFRWFKKKYQQNYFKSKSVRRFFTTNYFKSKAFHSVWLKAVYFKFSKYSNILKISFYKFKIISFHTLFYNIISLYYYNKGFFQITKKTTLKYHSGNYIIFDNNIKKKDSYLKNLIIGLVFYRSIKLFRARLNSHYVGSFDILLNIVSNSNVSKLGANFISTFFNLQLQKIPNKRMQQWFMGACKEFLKNFVLLEKNWILQKLQYINIKGVQLDIKGRAANMRRVFVKRKKYGHTYNTKHGYYDILKSYHFDYFTTKWGSTSIRVSYFYNNFYHNNNLTFFNNYKRRFNFINSITYKLLVYCPWHLNYSYSNINNNYRNIFYFNKQARLLNILNEYSMNSNYNKKQRNRKIKPVYCYNKLWYRKNFMRKSYKYKNSIILQKIREKKQHKNFKYSKNKKQHKNFKYSKNKK